MRGGRVIRSAVLEVSVIENCDLKHLSEVEFSVINTDLNLFILLFDVHTV